MPKDFQRYIDYIVAMKDVDECKKVKLPELEILELKDFLTGFLDAVVEVAKNDALTEKERAKEYKKIKKDWVQWRGTLYNEMEEYINQCCIAADSGCLAVTPVSFYEEIHRLQIALEEVLRRLDEQYKNKEIEL